MGGVGEEEVKAITFNVNLCCSDERKRHDQAIASFRLILRAGWEEWGKKK